MESTESPDWSETPEADRELEQAAQLLGEPEAVFRADGRRRRISTLMGVLALIFAGVANYVWWVHGPRQFGHLEFHFLVMPAVIGIGLLLFVYYHRGLRVAVYPTGLLRLRPGEVESVPFDEVTILRLKTTSGEPLIERDEHGAVTMAVLPMHVPTLRVWDAWFELETRTGDKSLFRPAVEDFPRLAELVQRKLFVQQWPAVVQTIERDGGSWLVGNLFLSREGLRVNGKLLPWHLVKQVKLEYGIVSITRLGSWRAYWAMQLPAIPNPHLFFALVAMLLPPPPSEPPPGDLSEQQAWADRDNVTA